MCGIAGFKGYNDQSLSNMVGKLSHRGPDHESCLIHSGYSLGMRRLAIIDLETGQQPIWNEDKTIAVFMNGEIYNYKQIRNQLIVQGHQFETQSDTEVLVHLYEAYHFNMLDFLEGMFAFCILDTRNKTLFMARDCFGEKPLYYYYEGNHFAFSSEITSLLQAPAVKKILNTAHVSSLLQFGYTLKSETLFKNVFVLPPGHCLIYGKDGLSLRDYGSLDYPSTPAPSNQNDIVDECRKLLYHSVEQRMVSDVPIGCFLSGGIDSSTITAIVKDLANGPVNTFNVRFEESGYDESPIARKVAKYLGTHHHELFLKSQVFEESHFNEMLLHFGQPFVDSSAIPTYAISKEIKQHVKVVLSGDGGDELFGGYRDFIWGKQIHTISRLPHSILKTGQRITQSKLLHHLPPVDFWRGLRRAIDFAMLPEQEWITELYTYFTQEELQLLLREYFQSASSESFFSNKSQQWSTLRKMMWFRLKYVMPGDMLVKVDRMSMCHSVEVRCPFLDSELFKFSAMLPDDALVKGNHGKMLIREVMKTQLPAVVFDHPKTGFNFPLHRYFNRSFKLFVRRILDTNHPLFEIIDRNSVMQIIEQGIKQQRSGLDQSVYKSAHRLWLLVQLFQWVNLFEVEVKTEN